MKTLALLISLFIAVQAIAQTPTKFQTDVLQFGRGASLLPKELIFDAGDGGSNKKFSLDPSDNELDLNTTLNITGNATVTGNLLAPTGQVNSSTLNVETTSTLKGVVTLGDGTNADRTLQVNRTTFDPYLRWKETLGKWVFSNDGTIEKPFGSGSGSGDGGINLLENPSFEDGVSVDWTSTCSSFTGQPYSNPKPNDTTFARCVASAPGEYFESVAKVVPDFFTGGCVAYGYYNTVTNNAFTLQIINGSTVINQVTLPTTDGKWLKTPAIAVTCPAAGSNIKLRGEALLAATIDFDNGYLGNENRLVSIQQSRLAGEAFFPTAASATCARTSTTVGPFTCNAAFTGPTIVRSHIGQWQTTDANLPRVTINNLPAGTYKAKFLTHQFMSVSAFAVLAINDGTTTCQPVGGNDVTNNAVGQVVECSFEYNQPGNRTFELYGASSSGTINVTNESVTPPNPTKFILEYYPSDSQTGVTNDQSGWMVDVNIGGANPLATVATSYTAWENGSLDMVINDGSAPVKIACSGTNPSTGLTCAAGNEQVGVSFNPPFTGYFDVCFYGGINNPNGFSVTNQWVLTGNTDQVIVQEGKTRTNSVNNHGGSTGSYPHTNCGTFYFSNTSEKTVRFAYESDSATNQILADRLANFGQRDMRITVRPSTMNIARPVLTGDQVTTPGQTKPVVFSATISTGSCTVIGQKGGRFLSPGVSNSAGDCTMTLTGLASAPNCTLSAQVGAGVVGRICARDDTTTWTNTTIRIQASNLGTATNEDCSIICHGEIQ